MKVLGDTVQIRTEHDVTTMHAGSRKSERSGQPKKWIQAKSQIVRTVILKVDRRARVQSKERIAGIQCSGLEMHMHHGVVDSGLPEVPGVPRVPS